VKGFSFLRTGRPRKNIPIEIYSNCDSVEVLLNGRSLGEKPIADAGRLIAVRNADLTDLASAKGGQTKLYRGNAVAVVRSAAAAGAGKITVRATAPGLRAGEAVLVVEP
jgi:hypothetical protein